MPCKKKQNMNVKGVFNHCGCFYRRRADTHVHHSSWFENWKKMGRYHARKKSTQYYLPGIFDMTLTYC